MTTFKGNMMSGLLVRLGIAALLAALLPATASAGIAGVSGSNFELTAEAAYISVADGGSIYSWGYGIDGVMQLPGPTLIVEQDVEVTIVLNNALPISAGNASIVFPGQVVASSGGVPGALTQEAPNGGSVTYTFTPERPGTYQYYSGTQPDLQVEMGLFGTLIVRPPAASVYADCAYEHAESCYDREYLYVLSEIDYDTHTAAELQAGGPGPIVLPGGAYVSEYWLMNGRVGPDTMAETTLPGAGILPHQPYGSLTRMHPGEKVLIRLVGAGRESHPFHTHGNHARVLAHDGSLLLTGSGALAGPLLFTLPSTPGGTTDAIFEWTGQDLGWDMYGHPPDDVDVDDTDGAFPNLGAGDIDHNGNGLFDVTPLEPYEWAPDHGRAIPVTLPDLSSLTFGGFWGGSPYLGDPGSLPPGEGGLNPEYGFTFMWHSHTERELVNNDVFPGGMMTMLIVEAPWVDID